MKPTNHEDSVFRTTLGIIAIAGVASAFACDKGTPKSDSAAAGQVMAMSTMHKASNAVEKLAADSSKDSDAIEVTRIPGYNDAQKFEQDSATSDYGPLARLYTLRRPRTDAEYQQGAMVAILEVDPDAKEYKAYKHLQVDKNTTNSAAVYCVFLRRESSGPQDWMGSLSLYDYATGDCAAPSYKIKADSTEPVTHAGTDFPDYAVRFTEGKGKWIALAVQCKNAICEIGNKKGDNDQPKSPAPTKVGKVKPWHDTQRLAMPKSGGGLEQGTSMTITPIDGLATASFHQADGAQAATIMVHGTPQGSNYATWGLLPNDSTQVWLRATTVTTDSSKWEMRMITTTGGNKTNWREINWNRHKKDLVPGTARWVWDAKDEGVWVACEQGCCEMTGGFTIIITPKGDTIRIPRDTTNGRGGRGNP
jgi:hypothetical protein